MSRTLMHTLKRFRNKVSIAAVHDDHLSSILAQAGLLEPILAATAKCSTCGLPLTLENLAGWLIHNGRLQPFCDRAICVTNISATETRPGNE